MPVPLGTGQGGRLPAAEDQAAALMSTAREDPATADLRQAVEHLQRQLQQLRDGGGEGPPRAPSGYIPQVNPTGADLGFKLGEIGAPNHRLVVENVLYLGVCNQPRYTNEWVGSLQGLAQSLSLRSAK